MATLREKINNNPQYVTIGTIAIIVIAIVFIYLQLRGPSRPAPAPAGSTPSVDRRTLRQNAAQPPAEGQAEQGEQTEQPAEEPQQ